MKFIAAFITLAVLIAAMLFLMFVQMVGLNGFSEKDAQAAMGLHLLWLLVSAILMAIVSFFLAGRFLLKSWSGGKALFAAVAITVAFGLVIDVVGFVSSLVLADYVRKERIKENLKNNEPKNN